ncbi:MAG: hypothetical protein AAB726_01420 [Patescibacteria group bacterium]
MAAKKLNHYKLAAALIVFAYALYYISDASISGWHLIDGVNLMFHEAGHAIIFFLGEFVQIAAGSLFQILIPAIFAAYFFIHRQHFSGSLVLFWLGQSLVNVSIYAGDAIRLQLPLLGGDSVIHDWNYLLSNLGILQHADKVSGGIYFLGLITIFAALALSVFFSFENKTKS